MPMKATVTDEAIVGEVPRLLGAKGAAPDPEGESVEEEDALQSCGMVALGSARRSSSNHFDKIVLPCTDAL